MELVILVALTLLSACTFTGKVESLPTDAASSTTTELPVKENITKIAKEMIASAKDLKEAMKAGKEARKSKKDCAEECGTEYDPICVHDPSDPVGFKPRTFGSQCALDVHNCEMGTKLVIKSKGECPGSGGVRLS